jgi:hypothetical protein
MITIFNGQTAIESILAGDGADETLANLDTETLLHLITAMQEGAITLTLKSPDLLITTGDGKQKHKMNPSGTDITCPLMFPT